VIDGLKGDKNFAERSAPDYLLPTDQFNRLQQVVQSNAMYNHLIRKFGLYQHYSIDTTREFHYERAVGRLRDNIVVKKTPFNSVSITVTDHFRYTAYEMANEIASWSDTLNRRLLRDLQSKRLAMYRRVDKQLDERLTNKQKELEALLKSTATRLSEQDEAVIGLRRSIHSLQYQIDDHGKAVKEQLYILESLQDRNLPTVMIQQRALPGPTSLLFPAIGYSLLVVAALISLAVIGQFFLHRYNGHLQLLRGNVKS
jgi:response regulator of citrate/malate metabolism